MEKVRLFCVSLGCDKNLVDTEKMLALIIDMDIEVTDDEMEADIILVNTCCFIGDAKEESINTILELAAYKQRGRCRALIVAGCLAQRYKQEILEEMPEVDAILGTTAWEEIGGVIRGLLHVPGKTQSCFHSLGELPGAGRKRVLSTGGHYAYLKIAEGCDKRCTYCVIPSVRGPYRSVPMEELAEEARILAEGGVRELILVAQETTLYGVDLYGEKRLPALLERLCAIDGIFWIRIQYCYPEEITDELIRTLRTQDKICHYLDIPIQHASDRILRRMGRKTNREEITKRILSLREEIPDIALRTTFISGFPGETDEEHEELLDFVDEIGFERLGVFTYSPEEDTPASTYPDQVPEEIKRKRRDEVMELQQEIAFAHGADMVGRELTVMIEGKVADEDVYVGRTYMDAPNVDGLIFVNTQNRLMSGDFVRVVVTASSEYDLIGEVLE